MSLDDELAKIENRLEYAPAAVQRLIDAAFGNVAEKPRFSIPAREEFDDDLIASNAVKAARSLLALARELRRQRDALASTVEYSSEANLEARDNDASLRQTLAEYDGTALAAMTNPVQSTPRKDET